MKSVVIRTDASQTIGSGHVMRCLTLARALRKRGADVHFICRNLPGNLSKIIKENKFRLSLLPHPENVKSPAPQVWSVEHQNNDFEDCEDILKDEQPELIIIDHYSLDFHWHRNARLYCRKIFVIDDLANRILDCDFLLDQTYSVKPQDYKNLVPENCEIFTGTSYALLREEFASLRQKAIYKRQSATNIENILISFGGSDQGNISLCALNACEAIFSSHRFQINLVVGSSNPHKKTLNDFIDKAQQQIKLHVDARNMAELMIEADLAIGAGGTTTWERCCLGLPTIVVCLADNQRTTIENLSNVGAVLSAGEASELCSDELSKLITGLLHDPDKLSAIQDVALQICDGSGTQKIAASLQSNIII